MAEQDIERQESRSSHVSLQQLEPSPIDSPASSESDSKEGEYFDNNTTPSDPTIKPSSSFLTRSQTLGTLGSHGPAYYLTRLQRYSSYAFTVFTAFHIANTSLIPLATRSISESDRYLLLTRPYYQSLPFEPLLITAPLALHISSGLALRVYRRRQQVHRYGAESASDRQRLPWPSPSGISKLGYVLTPLVIGHSVINRVLPLWYEGGSANVGLEYVAHGIAKAPAVGFVGFTVLVSVGVWHSVWGWAKWMGWTPAHVGLFGAEGQLVRKRRWYVINGVAALVTGLWLAGGLGVVGRGGPATGWLAKEYDELLSKIPLVGAWL